jgi:hypothetical protein
MFDMITLIKQAKPNDIVTLKSVTKADSYIIDHMTRLYFQKINDDEETVRVSILQDDFKPINIPLRSIKQIITPEGLFIFKADPRDIVYGS